ncbi:androgen-induced gene 1 protein isoform X2 [Bemisia tabaci]|uniref:androgen-induced gene 1 protein isoform X2 n=1 Tax=Bemisia tabaci TaxID=7038 RepID=UPI003B282A08
MALSSVLRTANVLLHVIGSILFCSGVYFHWQVKIPSKISPLDSAFGDKFKYLTFWNACIQAFFFTYCLILDIFVKSNPNKPPKTVAFKNYLFATIGFPIACFVATVFWGLYTLDRELVLPRVLDPYFPMWLNHIVHTMVAVFAVLEMLSAPHTYPERSRGLFTLGTFTVIYVVWVHIIYLKSDLWVYPILKELNLPFRMLFFAAMLAYAFLLYIIGDVVNKLVNKKVHKVNQSNILMISPEC